MSYNFTRMASLVLAFGFFISCSTSKSNINPEIDPPPLSETELEQKVDNINQKISSGDSSGTLLYQKGVFLTKLAQKKKPASDRAPLYSDARNALHSLLERPAGVTQKEKDAVRELLSVTWSNEHNQGVQIMQNDSTLDNDDYSLAAAHFKNATLIIPDSSVSYKMGARAYYQSQQPNKAVALLEEAQNHIDKMPTALIEQLAFLYLENNQPKKAIEAYEDAEPFSSQNLNLLHGLSNAYINAGEHNKSVALLERLVDQKPENIIYRQSLATELYYLAAHKIDSLAAQREVTPKAFHEADSILSRAENQLRELVDRNNRNMELKQRLAQFYHNSASKYQHLLPAAGEDQKAQIKSKIESFLSSSLPLLEQLVEQNPRGKVFWKNLYQAYSYLGMSEKARNAKSNI